MNEQKFQNIYHLTYPKISRYVVSKCRNIEDVKDILQNIYIDVYKKIDKIDFIENEAYLYTLTKNKVNQYYRFKFKHKDQSVPIEDEIKDDIDISRDMVIKASVEEVWNFIKRKPVIISKIFYFYFYLELTIREIASELQLNESTVKNYLYRTIKEIKFELERTEVYDNI